MRILHAFNKHRARGGADLAADRTLAMCAAHGLEVHAFQRDSRDLAPGWRGRLRAFTSGVYAREAVRAFRAELERLRPDVVHVHELYPLISPWILPHCRAARVPVVMSVSDFRLTCPITTHFHRGRICTRCLGGKPHRALLQNCRDNRLESASYALFGLVRQRFALFERHVDRFIMPSRFLLEWYVEHLGLPEERFTVVAPPVEVPDEPADPGLGSYVAFAGRFAETKGVEVLLRAIRRCGRPLRLAGDAERHPAVREGDPVCFVTTRGAEELARFYRGARLLVSPSLWHETFGVVPAEALAHGIPVIASRIGAFPELVVEGRTGLLFPPGDDEALARRIDELYDDLERLRTLGRNGRDAVRERCDAEAHFAGLLRAYEHVLARPR